MWASPGPYLRQSLLISLARTVSGLYRPEAFYQTTAFIEADGCASKTKDKEEDLTMSLAARVKEEDEMGKARRHNDEEEKENGEES